jgi:hypothetical protein
VRLTRVYTHKKACKGTKKNANTQIFTAKVNTYLSFLHSLHIDTPSQPKTIKAVFSRFHRDFSHFSSEIKRIIKKIKGEEKETFILEICINAIFLLPLQSVIIERL